MLQVVVQALLDDYLYVCMNDTHIFNNIKFLGSFPNLNSCPDQIRPEYAFIGRSNVGKSSLINMLMGRNNLARVSGKPGKTQLLNFFDIDDHWRIVDMPGYGYAKVSKSKRGTWKKMIFNYLESRKQLVCAFQLIDFKIDPQQKDLDFTRWLAEHQVPFALVYTKADRVKQHALNEKLELFQQAFSKYLVQMPEQFLTSSVKGGGRDELISYILNLNDEFYDHLRSL